MILLEDGGFLLQEDGISRILMEDEVAFIPNIVLIGHISSTSPKIAAPSSTTPTLANVTAS